MNWEPPLKPSEFAEARLIEAILDGVFPIDSNLPAERELAAMLGVTRPTLREALQRLARDGWVEIRHGHPTRVRDYWQEGQLAVLVAIAQRPDKLPADFVRMLLEVRLAMAPAYTRQAVERSAESLALFLSTLNTLEDSPEAFTAADWSLHHQLTMLSGNPVYTLILNGFGALYKAMGLKYFQLAEARQFSRNYYQTLLEAVQASDAVRAEDVSRSVMERSIVFWNKIKGGE